MEISPILDICGVNLINSAFPLHSTAILTLSGWFIKQKTTKNRSSLLDETFKKPPSILSVYQSGKSVER